MSSKLYRPDGEVTPLPVYWRSAGGAARPLNAPPPRVLQPPSSLSDAEVATRLEQAQRQGYATGEAAGMQKAMERLNPAIAAFQQIAQQLSTTPARVRQEAEAGVVQLAVAIARRILLREIAMDPEVILGLVKSAGARLNAREAQRLRLAPSDAQLVQEHRASLQLPPALEVIPDSALSPGSAIFETSRGEMDASIATQLDEIQRGLADLVQRRPR